MSRIPLPPVDESLLREVNEALGHPPARGFRLVVCAGNADGSMTQLREALGDGALRVVSVSVKPPARTLPASQVAPREIVMALGTVLGSSGLDHWVGWVGALVSGGGLGWVTVRHLLDHLDHVGVRNPAALAEACLGSVAQHGPTVLVIHDIERSPSLWRLLCHEVDSLDTGVHPLVVVISLPKAGRLIAVDDGWESEDWADEAWADVAGQVDALEGRDRAAWCPLPPLDADRIAAWLGPVQPDVVNLLLVESGAEDVAAGTFWDWWVRLGFVEQGAAGWRMPDPGADPVSILVEEAIERSLAPAAYGLARVALTCAGMCGPRFSVEAVAEVAAEMTGVGADDITDVLDALCPPREPNENLWLIKEEDTVIHRDAVGRKTFFWRYGFTLDILAAHFAARTTAEERPHLADRLFEATARLHANDDNYAADLAHLAWTAGRRSQAARFERLTRAHDRDREFVAYAQALLLSSDQGGEEGLARELIDVTGQLRRLGLHDLSVQVGARAIAVAESEGDSQVLAAAELQGGMAYVAAGGVGRAMGTRKNPGPLVKAHRYYANYYAEHPSPDARSLLAATLQVLGAAEDNRGNYPEAIAWLEQARGHRDALYAERPSPDTRSGLATTLHELGVVERGRGNYPEAIAWLEQARGHRHALYAEHASPDTRSLLATTLHELGIAEYDRANYPEAIAWAEQARGHQEALYAEHPSPYTRSRLAATFHDLGAVEYGRGNYREAIAWLEQARGHHHALYAEHPSPDTRSRLAATFHELGAVEYDRGNYPEAIAWLEQARGHREGLYAEHPSPTRQRSLQATKVALAKCVRS